MPRKKDKNKRKEKQAKKRKYFRKKPCPFCQDPSIEIDYKNVGMLKRFVTPAAKIVATRVSGVCAKHQRQLSLAIKRARHLALLPYTTLGKR